MSDDQFGWTTNRKKERVKHRRCKDCMAAYKREHYEKNRQKYLDRSKKWREDNHEQYLDSMHQYYRDNREVLLERAKEYGKTDIGRERNNQRSREYRRTPEGRLKEKARKKVNYAVFKGDIVKPDCCEKCGKEGYVEAHHDDYNKPLEIVWVCKQCHEDIHHLNEGHVSWTVTALKPSEQKDA